MNVKEEFYEKASDCAYDQREISWGGYELSEEVNGDEEEEGSLYELDSLVLFAERPSQVIYVSVKEIGPLLEMQVSS